MVKKIFSLFLALFALVAYQNCNSHGEDKVESSNINAERDTFLNKLKSDATTLITDTNCSYEALSCDTTDLDCIWSHLNSYYEALACQGYTTKVIDNCFWAVEKTDLLPGEDIHVELSCVSDPEQNMKSLSLGLCHIRQRQFTTEYISTDTVISAYLNLGDEFPFSRATTTIKAAPIEQVFSMQLVENHPDAELFVDACQKSRNIFWLGEAEEVQVNSQ